MVEKVLFLGQIFEVEILMDLHVMRTPESKNYIFSAWSVYVPFGVIKKDTPLVNKLCCVLVIKIPEVT